MISKTFSFQHKIRLNTDSPTNVFLLTHKQRSTSWKHTCNSRCIYYCTLKEQYKLWGLRGHASRHSVCRQTDQSCSQTSDKAMGNNFGLPKWITVLQVYHYINNEEWLCSFHTSSSFSCSFISTISSSATSFFSSLTFCSSSKYSVFTCTPGNSSFWTTTSAPVSYNTKQDSYFWRLWTSKFSDCSTLLHIFNPCLNPAVVCPTGSVDQPGPRNWKLHHCPPALQSPRPASTAQTALKSLPIILSETLTSSPSNNILPAPTSATD